MFTVDFCELLQPPMILLSFPGLPLHVFDAITKCMRRGLQITANSKSVSTKLEENDNSSQIYRDAKLTNMQKIITVHSDYRKTINIQRAHKKLEYNTYCEVLISIPYN